MTRTNQPTALVGSFAMDLLSAAADNVQSGGRGGGHLQAFDASPEEDSSEAIGLTDERIAAVDARAAIAKSIAEGFEGLAGFTVFDAAANEIYLEAFDTRPNLQSSATSVAMSAAFKRTMFGRLRPAGQPRLLGDAEPLDVR